MPGAVSKNIDLRLHAGPCDLVVGDRERLHQIFSNLVTNALKFTAAGGRVTLACEQMADELVVSVADTGVGIAPEFLTKVFDRFTQADTSSTRRYGGLGLGLAIVRQLVELHGGAVSADSEGPGKGSCFRVRLPAALARPDDLLQEPHGAETGAPRLDGVEILVVDDDRDALEAMTYALRATGAIVRPAASVRQAWAAFTEKQPDLVVSDLSMPDEDGYSLLRRLRAGRADPSVPAIALTGFTRPEDKARVLQAGFSAFVPKPIDPDELVRVLAKVLTRAAMSDS